MSPESRLHLELDDFSNAAGAQAPINESVRMVNYALLENVVELHILSHSQNHVLRRLMSTTMSRLAPVSAVMVIVR